MEKRSFLKKLSSISLLGFIPNKIFSNPLEELDVEKSSSEDEFWKRIRSHYDLNDEFINLESGYYNIIPKPTLLKHIEHIKHINREGSYYMRNNRLIDKKVITKRLAKFVGCDSNNIIITRNTTESLDLIIGGFPWKNGDEAIYAKQDYGAMKVMFEQVHKRHGVINKVVSVPNHPNSDDEIVSYMSHK